MPKNNAQQIVCEMSIIIMITTNIKTFEVGHGVNKLLMLGIKSC